VRAGWRGRFEARSAEKNLVWQPPDSKMTSPRSVAATVLKAHGVCSRLLKPK
jgi:hypothetical protein